MWTPLCSLLLMHLMAAATHANSCLGWLWLCTSDHPQQTAPMTFVEVLDVYTAYTIQIDTGNTCNEHNGCSHTFPTRLNWTCRRSYRKNEVIEENKALLKEKYAAAKALGKQVCYTPSSALIKLAYLSSMHSQCYHACVAYTQVHSCAFCMQAHKCLFVCKDGQMCCL